MARGNGATQVQIPRVGISDQADDFILLEISEREQQVNVEQPAHWQLSIANGGALVARFDIHVEGWIDSEWVSIEPASFNLYEGQRATAAISITPPRLPSSAAGVHQLAVVVTSPNYPGRRAQRSASLIINPYYDFGIGEISPRQQTVNYFRRTGQLQLTIRNKSNTESAFRIEGTDDENSVTFELRRPDNETVLVRQAEVSLEPDEEIAIPISATPRKHRAIGVGSQMHSLTVTTTMLEGEQTPRAVLAQMKNRPLVGPWLIIALAVLLAIVAIVILQPRIDTFEFAPDTVNSTEAVETEGEGVSAQALAQDAAALQGGKIFGIKIPEAAQTAQIRQ